MCNTKSFEKNVVLEETRAIRCFRIEQFEQMDFGRIHFFRK